jgi:hypothetical protein
LPPRKIYAPSNVKCAFIDGSAAPYFRNFKIVIYPEVFVLLFYGLTKGSLKDLF